MDDHRHEMKEIKLIAELDFLKTNLLNNKEEHEELLKQNIHLKADIRVYKENEMRENRKRRKRRGSESVASEMSEPSENEDASLPIDSVRTITRSRNYLNRNSLSSYPSIQNYFISLPTDGTYEPVQDSGYSAASSNNNNINTCGDDNDVYS